jgi:hypothetical protein
MLHVCYVIGGRIIPTQLTVSALIVAVKLKVWTKKINKYIVPK